MESAEPPQITDTIFSKRDKRMFGLDLHRWETVVIWSLGAAALAAFAVVVATRMVILLQRESIQASADELARYKLDAGVKIAEATESASKAIERAAEANRKAEEERLARLKLEEIVAPRSMSLEQKTALVAAWKRYAGRPVLVSSYSMDTEGVVLGLQIVEALQAAGVNVMVALSTEVPVGHLAFGVHITATPNRELAHGLSNALGEKTSLQVTYNPQRREGEMRQVLGGLDDSKAEAIILIASKPVPGTKK